MIQQRVIKFIIFLLLVIGVSGTEIAPAYAGVEKEDSEVRDHSTVSGVRLSSKKNSLSAVVDVPGGLGFEFTRYLEDRRQLAINGSTWLFLTKGSANLRYYLRENNLRKHHRIFAGLGAGVLWLPVVAVLSSESPFFPMFEPQFGYEYVANNGFTLRAQISSTIIFKRVSSELAVLPIPTGSVRIGWSF